MLPRAPGCGEMFVLCTGITTIGRLTRELGVCGEAELVDFVECLASFVIVPVVHQSKE